MSTTTHPAVLQLRKIVTYSDIPLEKQSQAYVVSIFSLLAFVSLALFGLLQVVAEHDPRLGYLELAGGSTILLNMVALRLTRNIRLARDLLLLSILTFLMVMLVSGGTQGTGIFWYFVFPVSAFFLSGKRQGIYWMAALVIASLFFVVLAQHNIITIGYSFVVIRQLLVSVVVLAAGIYVYQQAREKAERVMHAEQEELSQAKDEFLALASHQLRTPISAIAWFGEMLLHGDAGKLSKTQNEYVEQVYDSNQRSAAIVDAIITVTSLHAKTLTTHLESVDISAICKQAVRAILTGSQHAKTLHVNEQYEPDLPKLRCDAALTRTVVQNLVSNAIKYTPAGGHIDISVDPGGPKLSPRSKGTMQIKVKDTGYGIPKSQQDKIFAKLFRASNITSKDTDGTGLGLYIVKEILEQVGGQIRFESEEDHGSTFVALIPLEGMRAVKKAGQQHV
ncbi:MAG: sensor histidine kinase [Candidatus Saccharibacteria bacterium]